MTCDLELQWKYMYMYIFHYLCNISTVNNQEVAKCLYEPHAWPYLLLMAILLHYPVKWNFQETRSAVKLIRNYLVSNQKFYLVLNNNKSVNIKII